MRWSAEILLMSVFTVLVAVALASEPRLAILSQLFGADFIQWQQADVHVESLVTPIALLALAILLPVIFRDNLNPMVTHVGGATIAALCAGLSFVAGSSAEAALLSAGLGTLGTFRSRVLGPLSARSFNSEWLARAFAESPDAALVVNRSGDVVYSTAETKKLCGFNPEKYGLSRLLPDFDWQTCFERKSWTGIEIQTTLIQESLAKMQVSLAINTMGTNETAFAIMRILNVTDHQQKIAELTDLALKDPLTGLANRALFDDRINQTLANAERHGGNVALLLLDLDKFKQINDSFGHHVGDLLLQKVGPRLAEPLRKSDTLARLGGDEFSIILSQSINLNHACHVAERIVERLAEPFEIEGMTLEIGTSIGVALYPEHGTDAISLSKNADAAMYKAKRERLGFCVFNTEDRASNLRRIALQRGLRKAIDSDELLLYLQPKVHAGTRELVGCEALVRWQHTEFGVLAPDEFLTIAEQTGLIMPLTLWVFNACLRAQESWRQSGIDIPIAINISPRWLSDPSFPKILKLLMRNWEGKADRFVLEVTERGINNDPKAATQVLRGLSKIGCKISLDDFGTGYSSLGNLQSLPIDELKIDKSFVANMGEDDNAAIVVRSIVKLAHALGMQVVAEGVETVDVADYLTSMGCDVLQGFYIGRPSTLDEFDKWLLGGGSLFDYHENDIS